MTDLTIRVPAIEKLIDYVASGIGAVAGPMLAPRWAGREGRARVVAARADAEVSSIEAESDAKSLRIIANAQTEARQYLLPSSDHVSGTVEIARDDVFQRIKFQEQKRLANIRSVVNEAASDLDGKVVSNHDPDPDWTARFFDCVQDVSSDDMQKLWAKILSGEVEMPGRTSLRTLDTLRNMTKTEAELFRRMCVFVIRDDFLFFDGTSRQSDSTSRFQAISYENVLRLQDCNLISVEPGLVQSFELREGVQFILDYQSDGLMIKNRRKGNTTINIPMVRLTSSGVNLFRFVRRRPQMDYVRALAEFLNGNGCELHYLRSMKRISGGTVRFAESFLIGKTID